jgi:hypothetical protein
MCIWANIHSYGYPNIQCVTGKREPPDLKMYLELFAEVSHTLPDNFRYFHADFQKKMSVGSVVCVLPPITFESTGPVARKSVKTLSHQRWHYFKSLTATIYTCKLYNFFKDDQREHYLI